MNVRTEWNGFAWLEQYAWLVLPLIFWGVIWRQILTNHKKHPIPLGIMSTWIAYTVLTISLLILGVLWSGAFFVAFVCLTFSMFVWIQNWFSRQRDKRCTAYTEGTVVSLRRVTTRNRICYYPTIVFYVDGERYCEESPVSCSQEELYKSCWVKYNPNDPHKITQEQYDDGGKKVLLVVGIILLCVSVICVFIGIANIAWMLG